MELAAYSWPELVSECADAQLRKTGGILIRGAISRELAETAHATLGVILKHPETPQRYPFDLEARTGYTAPCVESFQRDPRERDEHRHLFDYRPELPIGGATLRCLFGEALGACQRLMSLIDAAHQTRLSHFPAGLHSLRSAQYLREGTTATEVLFGEHCDFSLLTVFIGLDEPGLQIGCKGAWIPVELGYGDIFIGGGTPLRYFVPEYRSLKHRVVGGGNDHRVSSFFFYELGDDVPLPGRDETYGQMWRRITNDIRMPA